MGLFRSIFSRKSELAVEEKASGGIEIINTPARLASSELAGMETASGETVSMNSAIQLATVWACVRLLSETIAQIPVHVFVRGKDGSKTRVTDTALSERLSYQPNSWQTPFEYAEFEMTGLCMRGNSYAVKVCNSGGEVMELLPLKPASVQVKCKGLSDVSYVVTIDGQQETFGRDEIAHVRGLTFDGFRGVSPIEHHRETVGLTSAASVYGARLFKNLARPSGVIEVPGELSESAYERLKNSWGEQYGGENIGKAALLEQGSKFSTVSMSNADAQYLDVRQFQRTEICSIYRIPPHMIGDLTKSSFSNINQQGLEFIKYTILPWCVRREQAIMRDLMPARERQRGMFVEHVVAGLERADIRTRYQAYKEGINGGWLSPNEVRRKENMNPRPGGDIYSFPLNMVDSSGGAPKPAKRVVKSVQLKGVVVREQVRKKFRGRFEKVARNVVKAEAAMVRGLMSKKSVPDNLSELLDEAYSSFPAKFESAFRSLVREYGAAVRNVALKETDHEGEVDVDAFSAFLESVLEAMGMKHVASSSGQLQAIVRDVEPDELLEAMEQRLSEWEERRPAKIAEAETVGRESAISRFVWGAVGVSTLVWVNRGSKSCPFCTSLDGKVVGINAPFIEHGNYEPEGYENSPWKVRGPKMHPQLHEGCQCAIVPGD